MAHGSSEAVKLPNHNGVEAPLVRITQLDSWSYEREWRILFPLAMGTKTNILDSFGQPVIVFPFPGACLTEVIVGSRATEDLFQIISRICQGLPNTVPVSKGAW